MNVAFQEMINRVKTEYFIQVDEDMILNPDAVAIMLETMEAAPEDVGMICFHLWDDDRECRIQGIKIYRTKHMKNIIWKDVKASEVDILYLFSDECEVDFASGYPWPSWCDLYVRYDLFTL